MRHKITKENAMLLLGTLLFILVLGEVTLRWIIDLNIIRFQVDENLLWKYRPNQQGRLWMGRASFRSPLTTTNEFGFRGKNWELEENDLKIITIGDSFVFGTGVLDTQTTSYLLEKKLQLLSNDANSGRIVKVVNLGMSGYGLFQAKEALSMFLNDISPEIVILVFHPGMINRQPFNSEKEKKEFIKKSKIRQKIRDISVFITFVYRKLWYLTHSVTELNSQEREAMRKVNWKKDISRIKQISKLCNSVKAKFFILLWPFPPLPEWSQKIKQDLNAIANEAKFVVLADLDIEFKKYRWDDLLIAGDGHPTALAHSLAADYLSKEVAKYLNFSN